MGSPILNENGVVHFVQEDTFGVMNQILNQAGWFLFLSLSVVMILPNSNLML